MANQTSKIINFIINEFDKMELVNKISLRDDDVIDVEKENIYPLVSIRIGSFSILEDRVAMKVSFKIATQRDANKKPKTSKLLKDTNYIDNVNIVNTIANDFVIGIWHNHNEHDINIEEVSSFDPVDDDERNGLDGITFEATFSTHQNGI
jgi:hypothetical protein